MNVFNTLPKPEVLNSVAPKSMPICFQILLTLHCEQEKAAMIALPKDFEIEPWIICVSMDIMQIKPSGCHALIVTEALMDKCECIKKRKRESNFWKN